MQSAVLPPGAQGDATRQASQRRPPAHCVATTIATIGTSSGGPPPRASRPPPHRSHARPPRPCPGGQSTRMPLAPRTDPN
eukprot:5203688-Pyramimonas_sp.AAC.1